MGDASTVESAGRCERLSPKPQTLVLLGSRKKGVNKKTLVLARWEATNPKPRRQASNPHAMHSKFSQELAALPRKSGSPTSPKSQTLLLAQACVGSCMHPWREGRTPLIVQEEGGSGGPRLDLKSPTSKKPKCGPQQLRLRPARACSNFFFLP